MLESNFVSGIVGALLGAIVSGIISYCLQASTFKEAEKDKIQEKLERDQSLATTLLIKLGRILTGFHGVAEHLSDCNSKGMTEKPPMARWQSFVPLANLREPSRFTPDELSLLLRLKANDLFNLVVNLDVIHNGLISPMQEAAELKDEIRQAIGVTEVAGDKATSVFDKNTYLAIQPLIRQLDTLLVLIETEASRSRDESHSAITQLVGIADQKLGMTLNVMTNIEALP